MVTEITTKNTFGSRVYRLICDKFGNIVVNDNIESKYYLDEPRLHLDNVYITHQSYLRDLYYKEYPKRLSESYNKRPIRLEVFVLAENYQQAMKKGEQLFNKWFYDWIKERFPCTLTIQKKFEEVTWQEIHDQLLFIDKNHQISVFGE